MTISSTAEPEPRFHIQAADTVSGDSVIVTAEGVTVSSQEGSLSCDQPTSWVLLIVLALISLAAARHSSSS